MSVKYTAQQKDWLLCHWSDYRTYADITEGFNGWFGTSRTKSALMQYGVKTLKLPAKFNPMYIKYTEEELNFIKDNYYKCQTYNELVDLVNERFHTNRNVSMIMDKCTKYLKLKPHHMKNVGVFGSRYKTQSPIGTIRVAQTGTYIKVRLKELNVEGHGRYITGYNEPYWKPIQKKIYEDAHGELSEDKMVCFLDGNRENLSLDNLYAIDRRISAILSQFGWWSKDRDITLAAIKYAELYYSVKDAKDV